jgi:rhodanese-related sulfurtransferase
MSRYDATALSAAITTANGELEVSARWAKEHLGTFRFIDVREPHELEGPLGRAEGAENIPLLAVLGACESCDRDMPLVLICRSGRRSALAAGELKRAGVKTVASVEGGMLAWNLQVEGRGSIVEDERTANVHNLAGAVFTTNGIPEVSAGWVRENLGRFRLIDVRGPDELRMSGHIPQAENIPLPEFMSKAAGWGRDLPLVIMCASGGRSGRAVGALVAAGFSNVASLEGGMYGWRSAGLPHA